MSKAYLALKNFTWPQMLNLIAYGAKHPETLSQTQRITRLYRATIRRNYTSQLENFRPDHIRFHDQLQKHQQDFYRLEELNKNFATLSIAEKIEFQQLEKKYVDWHEQMYDAFLYVEECRPYSSTSTRYIIPDDEMLKYDPHGYYSKKLVSDNRPSEQTPFFADYPIKDNHWVLEEQFPDLH